MIAEKILNNIGWTREQLAIDQLNSEYVETYSTNKRGGEIIKIKCPKNKIIAIIGIRDLPEDSDNRIAHSLRCKFEDKDGIEIPFNTKIHVVHNKKQVARMFYADLTSTKSQKVLRTKSEEDKEWMKFVTDINKVVTVSEQKEMFELKDSVLNSLILLLDAKRGDPLKSNNDWLRFKDSIILKSGDELSICVIKDVDIDKSKTTFALDCDIYSFDNIRENE